MEQEAASIESGAGCFVFAGVELDADKHSLRVDGQVVQCSRKAFELLLQLCLVSNRVQSRDELIAALWPGGQIVSDEALTQVIFRARAVLGQHASALLTVRGVGLRLGVPVTRRPHDHGDKILLPTGLPPSAAPRRRAGDAESAAERPETLIAAPVAAPIATRPLAPPATAPLVPTNDEPATPARRPWRLRRVVIVASIFAATVIGLRLGIAPVAVVDAGYGLYETDLHGSDPRSTGLVREAFIHDAQGDRGRGEALLQAVHQADATTPVPAAFLALWAAGTGNAERAALWLEQANQRARPLHDVYVNLLLGYVDAELNDSPAAVMRQAGALLNIRPQAWQMRLARAHLMVAANLRTAALHEIQQIDVPALGHRKLEMVIADRASLGDIAGAQALLDRLPRREDAAYAFVLGRIAWSRGDFDAAYRAFRDCADYSVASARLDLRRRALVSVAAIEVMRHQDQAAIAGLERARASLATTANPISDFDTSLFLAELHARAMNQAATHAELDRAIAAANTTQSAEFQLIAALVAARLRPAIDPPLPAAVDAAGEALWRARSAWNRGEREAAMLALTDAQRRGVFDTRLVEEARYLAWQLGQPVPAERALDPPFPPLAVAVLRRDLREALAKPH